MSATRKEYECLLKVIRRAKAERCSGCGLTYPRGVPMIQTLELYLLCKRCIDAADTMLVNAR